MAVINKAQTRTHTNCPLCHESTWNCEHGMEVTSHMLRAVVRMEGMALVQIGNPSYSVKNVLYPTTTPAGMDNFRLTTQSAPIYRKIRTIRDCEEGRRTLQGIMAKVIGEDEPLTQEDLSQLRILYKQFEDLLWYLLAMSDPDIPACDRQHTRDLMSVRKASQYFSAYAQKTNRLLRIVDRRNMEEAD